MASTKRYTTVQEQVEYALDTIDERRRVEVPLRSLMYVFKVLEQYNSFFHQPMHYPDLNSVQRFLENPGGAYDVLQKALYDHFEKMLPPDIKAAFDTNRFEHPDPPHFFKPHDEEPDPGTA